jgi:cytochrome c-type biogenesis protein
VTETIAFAFAAGLVAALNPCGFALLPAYLALVVLGDERAGETAPGRGVAVLRALAATAAMTIGFLAVFGAFGLLIAPLATSAQRYLPAVTVVMGAVLVGLGGWLLAGRELRALLPKPRGGAPTGRLRSMVLYGVGYALASLSCTIAPFLAVTAGTFRAGDPLTGLAGYAAYALGMGLLVGVLATAVALTQDAVAGWLRRALPHVSRLSGALLIVVGLYVAYYGVYELRLFNFEVNPSDPVVDAAGRVQSWLVSTTDSIGWLPLASVLLVLVVAAAVSRFAAGRRPARRD